MSPWVRRALIVGDSYVQSLTLPNSVDIVLCICLYSFHEAFFISPHLSVLTHRFHPICGKQVTLSDQVTASRAANTFSHGLVFSADPLQNEEVFEVRVQKVHPHFTGSLRIGLTNLNVPHVSTDHRSAISTGSYDVCLINFSPCN